MEADSLEFGRRERVLIFINGNFGKELYYRLSGKYSTKSLEEVSIEDIENRRTDVLIINDRESFDRVIKKYGIYLERFFKIELSSLENDLFDLLDKYFNLEVRQRGLVELLNEFKSLEKIISFFPSESIKVRSEYEDDSISIISICYIDGKQIFHGLTRDYRGETVLFNKISGNYFLLRGNLPVFEEYFSFVNVDDNMQTLLTPKFDGSLINVTFIHKDYDFYKLLRNKPLKMYLVNTGIAFIGTKNLLITNDPVILKRLQRGICEPIEQFIKTLVSKVNRAMNVVFHFELMASDEFGNQSVAYDRPFCVLLGLTYFDDNTKQFYLPRNEYSSCIKLLKFKSRFDVENYVNSQHKQILNGDMSVEPEGFVIYTPDSVFKYKFPEYYVAHKPSCNFEDALKLSDQFNGKTRYVKLQVPLSSKISEISRLLNKVYSMSLDERYALVKNNKSFLIKIDDAMNNIRFTRRKKFKVSEFLTENNKITHEMFINYALDFLKGR